MYPARNWLPSTNLTAVMWWLNVSATLGDALSWMEPSAAVVLAVMKSTWSLALGATCTVNRCGPAFLLLMAASVSVTYCDP